jgi:hypothetical protein
LLLVTSAEGAQYDLHAIVPPHLEAQDIGAKISTEIQRLKARDLENEGKEDFDEYDRTTIEAFLSKLGVLVINEPMTANECWDV